MLHVIVIAYALFLTPQGDVKLAKATTASPLECAQVINDHPIIELDDGFYTMVKAECHGAYVDDTGNVVSYDGNAQ